MTREFRLPASGEVFLDTRGDSRALRISWHPEGGMVVLSLWRDRTCAASFRLAIDEVPQLIYALSRGLAGDGAGAVYAPEARAAG